MGRVAGSGRYSRFGHRMPENWPRGNGGSPLQKWLPIHCVRVTLVQKESQNACYTSPNQHWHLL
jgi:hypothetical protein